MMILRYFIAIFFIWNPNTFAQNPNQIMDQLSKINQPKKCTVESGMEYVCDSMSKFSCKPGTFDDGTGKVISEEDYQKNSEKIFEKVRSIYEEANLKVLLNRDPKFDLVREMALKGTDQVGTPGCSSGQGSETKNPDFKSCMKRVASILGAMKAKSEVKMITDPVSGMSMKPMKFDMQSISELYNNQAYSNEMNAAQKKSIQIASDEKISRKVERDVFPRVKQIIINKINSSVQDPEIRKKIIQKIQNITYNGNDCNEMLPHESRGVGGFLIENAFYDSDNQTFRFCNGFLLKNNSEFSIAMVVAHELSHSIDPCGIQSPKSMAPVKFGPVQDHYPKEFEDQFPINHLLSCLRSKESIGAVSLLDSFPLFDYQKPFCGDDQIGESFSDWMGAEVLADYSEKHFSSLSPNQKLIGFSNVFRNLCIDGTPMGFDVHPDTKARIDRLIMANPKIREQIGCGDPKGNLHYCKPGEKFEGTRQVYTRPNNSTVYIGGSNNP